MRAVPQRVERQRDDALASARSRPGGPRSSKKWPEHLADAAGARDDRDLVGLDHAGGHQLRLVTAVPMPISMRSLSRRARRPRRRRAGPRSTVAVPDGVGHERHRHEHAPAPPVRSARRLDDLVRVGVRGRGSSPPISERSADAGSRLGRDLRRRLRACGRSRRRSPCSAARADLAGEERRRPRRRAPRAAARPGAGR